MELFGLNKIVDTLGNAFGVFDFSFFISGAVTLGFIALDLHYYGHDGILQLQGWTSVLIYILAIYVCGLMSWNVGKLMRWGLLRLIWGKGGVKKDFNKIFKEVKSYKVRKGDTANSTDAPSYQQMWIKIELDSKSAGRMLFLNKMWVMVALFEGLSFSWIVGLLVYLDGWLVGGWITTSNVYFNIVPCAVLIGFAIVSFHRATIYSQDLIKEVAATFNSLD